MESYKLHNTSLYSTIHLSQLPSFLKKQTAVCLKTRKAQYFPVSSDSYFSRDAIMQLRPGTLAGVLWVGEASCLVGVIGKQVLWSFILWENKVQATESMTDVWEYQRERKKIYRWGILWILYWVTHSPAWIYKLFRDVFINSTYICLWKKINDLIKHICHA